MSATLPRTFHRQIISEINRWQGEKLISSELAASLKGRYSEPVIKNRLITILMMLGAILIGLGALLFIGSNWEHLSSVIKVEIIAAAILITHALAWQFRFAPGKRPRLGEGLFLAGSIFYGAGIWLLSQIFNMDISLTNGLLLWILGSGAMALAVKSAPLACLTAILIGSYNLSYHSPIFGVNWDAFREPLLQFALAFAFSVWLGYFLRSPWSIVLTFVGGAFWISANASVFGLLAYGIAQFALYLYHRERWQQFAPAYLYNGVITTLLSMFYMTFSHGDYAIDPGNGYMIGFASLIVLVAVATLFRQYGVEIICTGTILLGGWLCSAVLNNLNDVIVANLFMFAAMVGLIFAGLYRLRSAAVVNITLVFFVVDIIARYFDTFFKMLDRSVFFILGGIMLVVIGSYLEQTRRRLLEGFHS